MKLVVASRRLSQAQGRQRMRSAENDVKQASQACLVTQPAAILPDSTVVCQTAPLCHSKAALQGARQPPAMPMHEQQQAATTTADMYLPLSGQQGLAEQPSAAAVRCLPWLLPDQSFPCVRGEALLEPGLPIAAELLNQLRVQTLSSTCWSAVKLSKCPASHWITSRC